MKILHFIYDHMHNPWIGGGGAIRTYEIYRRLSERGHEITVVSGRHPNARDYRDGNLHFKFVGIDNNYILSTFSYAYYAHRFLKQNCGYYDVLVEDFAPWNPVFSYKYQDKTPAVLQIQGYMGGEILKRYAIFGIPFFFIEKNYPRKFRRSIVVNDALRERYRLFQAVVIGNGIDESLLRENIRHNGNYIGYIGRIDFYGKGFDILFSQTSSLPIKICGTGKKKDMKKLHAYLDKNRHTEYLGYVSGKDKIHFIQDANFFVLPSRFEAQPLTVLEVAALGKPLVVSDIPELRFVAEKGFGISFKSGDEEDLQEKIGYLWENDILTEEMGRNGREFARNHTWDMVADLYERFLIKVTGKVNENPDLKPS